MGLFSKKEYPEITDEMFIEALQKLAINKLLIELYTCKSEMLQQMLRFEKPSFDIEKLDSLEEDIRAYVLSITDEDRLNDIIITAQENFVLLYEQKNH